ncbi:hypothetical protein [Salinimonas sediminis]|uniref:Uncharacterized protein n=1 Tax=Salinimonas sediminis TaxID=2303538 RepID=A0A346NHH6_9ALTE|nr:hypothetical protein [Salinimonas sediminis]AXR04983.1 hypothetical protein D0Y50_00525 [Salinimonas sediminis]
MKTCKDVQHLKLYRRLGGNAVLVEKLVTRFSTSLPILIVRLTQAVRCRDAQRASTQIKMLKEVACALSAHPIINDLTQLEGFLAHQPPAQWHTCIGNIETIARAFTDCISQYFPAPAQPE